MSKSKKIVTMIKLQNLVEEKLKIEKEKEEVLKLRMSLEGDLEKKEEAISLISSKIEEAEKNKELYDESYKNEMAAINKLEIDIGTNEIKVHEYEEKEKQKEQHINNKNQFLNLKKRADEEVKKYQRELSSLKKDLESMEEEKGERISEADRKISELTISIDEKIDEINKEKKGIVTDEEYERLEKVASKKNGKGFVPIFGQVCQGCNMVLPLESVIDIRINQTKEDSFGTCPYCSRMIYYEDPLEVIDGQSVEHYDEKNYLFDDTNGGINTNIRQGKKGKKKEEEIEEEYEDEILQTDDGDYFEDF